MILVVIEIIYLEAENCFHNEYKSTKYLLLVIQLCIRIIGYKMCALRKFQDKEVTLVSWD